MLTRTTVTEIPSVCYTLKFNSIKDYFKVYNELNTPFYWNLEDFDMIGDNPQTKEIDIELGYSYIQEFVNDLRSIKDFEAEFIMTQDLRKDPSFVFNKEVK